MKGFSLIETVIYIALLGLLMSGAVAVSYQLTQGSQNLYAKNVVGEEGNFVLRKLGWALSGAQTITAPAAWGSTLSLTRYDGTTVDVRLTGTAIEMRQNSGAWEALTTSNVSVSALGFGYIAAAGGAPAGVEASTTLSNLTFNAKHYLRK